jgi:hypothetical protein
LLAFQGESLRVSLLVNFAEALDPNETREVTVTEARSARRRSTRVWRGLDRETRRFDEPTKDDDVKLFNKDYDSRKAFK